MGHRRFITFRDEISHEDVDLEIPGDRPIGELTPILLKALWPDQKWQNYGIQLYNDDNIMLQKNQTLEQAEVENSDILLIRLIEKSQAHLQNEISHDETISAPPQVSKESPPSPQDIRGNFPPRKQNQLQILQPSLVDTEHGLIFVLGNSLVKIGRPKGNDKPDIDLTEIDPGLATSRKHAEIHIHEGKYTIKDLNSANGTFVNGEEVLPNSSYSLRDDDTVLFGVGGPKLKFQIPQKS